MTPTRDELVELLGWLAGALENRLTIVTPNEVVALAAEARAASEEMKAGPFPVPCPNGSPTCEDCSEKKWRTFDTRLTVCDACGCVVGWEDASPAAGEPGKETT